MALGSTQTATINAASSSCAAALKRMGRHRLRASVAKALIAKDPEKGMAQLVEVLFKASVLKLSDGVSEALPALQYHYQRFLELYHASPSAANRLHMLQLFRRGMKS
jgi:hypothetical protein